MFFSTITSVESKKATNVIPFGHDAVDNIKISRLIRKRMNKISLTEWGKRFTCWPFPELLADETLLATWPERDRLGVIPTFSPFKIDSTTENKFKNKN